MIKPCIWTVKDLAPGIGLDVVYVGHCAQCNATIYCKGSGYPWVHTQTDSEVCDQ